MARRCAAAVCALVVIVVACSEVDEPEARSPAASTTVQSEESAPTNALTTSTEARVSATVTSPATTGSTVGASELTSTTLVAEYVPVPERVPPPEPLGDDANGAVELVALQGCDPDDPASPAVVLSWTPASDAQQLVAVATLADGFETNRFTVSDELSSDISTFRISPVEPGGIYYWRVLTWDDGEWSASDISTFTGPTCILDSRSSP